jgi:hypothetical protein
MTGGFKKLHNEEFHNLYTSQYIVRVIKSRGKRWVGHVVRMGEIRNAYRLFGTKSEGKNQVEELYVDGRIILDWILEKYGGKVWAGFI